VTRGQQQRLAFGVPRGWALRIVLACIALGAISVQLVPPNYHWRTIVSSGSRGRTVQLGPHPELCAALSRPNGILRISGHVTVATLTNYPNVFATAPPDRGVRLEVEPSGTVGAVFFDRKFGVVGVGSNVLVHSRQPWSFLLDIREGGLITLEVQRTSLAKTLTRLILTCDQVEVGGGFDASRQLHGVADNVTFLSGIETPAFPAMTVISGAGVVLLLWLLGGSIAGPSRRGQRAGKLDD
jgi:hypothetical protein